MLELAGSEEIRIVGLQSVTKEKKGVAAIGCITMEISHVPTGKD